MNTSRRLRASCAVAAIAVCAADSAAHAEGLANLRLNAPRDAQVPSMVEAALSTMNTGIMAETVERDSDGVVLRNVMIVPQGGMPAVIEDMRVIEDGDTAEIVSNRDDGLLRIVMMSEFLEVDIGSLDIRVGNPGDDAAILEIEGAGDTRSWRSLGHTPMELDAEDNPITDPDFNLSISDFHLHLNITPAKLSLELGMRDVISDYVNAGSATLTEDEIQDGTPGGSLSIENFFWRSAQERITGGQSFDDVYEAIKNGASIEIAANFNGLKARHENRNGDEVDVDIGGAGFYLAADSEMFHIATDAGDVATTFGNFGILPTQDGQSATLNMDYHYFSMNTPLLGSDEPQSVGVSLALLGMAPDESGWDFIDPQGAFDRTPLDFKIEMDGEVLIPRATTKSPEGDTSYFFGFGALGVLMLLEHIESFEATMEGGFAGLGAEIVLDAASEMSIDDLAPEVSGMIRLSGIEDSLEGLSRLPFFGPYVVTPLAVMAEKFAVPGSEGSQVLEFEADQNGNVTVNGEPVSGTTIIRPATPP